MSKRPTISINTLVRVSLVVGLISLVVFLITAILRFQSWSLSENIEVTVVSSVYSHSVRSSSGSSTRTSTHTERIYGTRVVDSDGRVYEFQSPRQFRTNSRMHMRVIRDQRRVVQFNTVFWWPVLFFGGLSFFSYGINYSARKYRRLHMNEMQ